MLSGIPRHEGGYGCLRKIASALSGPRDQGVELIVGHRLEGPIKLLEAGARGQERGEDLRASCCRSCSGRARISLVKALTLAASMQ